MDQQDPEREFAFVTFNGLGAYERTRPNRGPDAESSSSSAGASSGQGVGSGVGSSSHLVLTVRSTGQELVVVQQQTQYRPRQVQLGYTFQLQAPLETIQAEQLQPHAGIDPDQLLFVSRDFAWACPSQAVAAYGPGGHAESPRRFWSLAVLIPETGFRFHTHPLTSPMTSMINFSLH
jgi:hypothetical protein